MSELIQITTPAAPRDYTQNQNGGRQQNIQQNPTGQVFDLGNQMEIVKTNDRGGENAEQNLKDDSGGLLRTPSDSIKNPSSAIAVTKELISKEAINLIRETADAETMTKITEFASEVMLTPKSLAADMAAQQRNSTIFGDRLWNVLKQITDMTGSKEFEAAAADFAKAAANVSVKDEILKSLAANFKYLSTEAAPGKAVSDELAAAAKALSGSDAAKNFSALKPTLLKLIGFTEQSLLLNDNTKNLLPLIVHSMSRYSDNPDALRESFDALLMISESLELTDEQLAALGMDKTAETPREQPSEAFPDGVFTHHGPGKPGAADPGVKAPPPDNPFVSKRPVPDKGGMQTPGGTDNSRVPARSSSEAHATNEGEAESAAATSGNTGKTDTENPSPFAQNNREPAAHAVSETDNTAFKAPPASDSGGVNAAEEDPGKGAPAADRPDGLPGAAEKPVSPFSKRNTLQNRPAADEPFAREINSDNSRKNARTRPAGGIIPDSAAPKAAQGSKEQAGSPVRSGEPLFTEKYKAPPLTEHLEKLFDEFITKNEHLPSDIKQAFLFDAQAAAHEENIRSAVTLLSAGAKHMAARMPYEDVSTVLSTVDFTEGAGALKKALGTIIPNTHAMRTALKTIFDDLENTRDLDAMVTRLNIILENIDEDSSENMIKLAQGLNSSLNEMAASGDYKVSASTSMETLTDFVAKNINNSFLQKLSGASGSEMVQNLLTAPGVFTPLLHHFVPLDAFGLRAFGELWVDPHAEELIENKGRGKVSAAGTHLFLCFDIEDTGYFELEIYEQEKNMSVMLLCPERMTDLYEPIKKTIPKIAAENGYHVTASVVSRLTEKRTLDKVFPKINEQRSGLNVKV